MADFTFSIRSEDEYSAMLRDLQGQLSAVQRQLREAGESAARMGTQLNQAIGGPLTSAIDQLNTKIRELNTAYVQFSKSTIGDDQAAKDRLYDLDRLIDKYSQIGNLQDQNERRGRTRSREDRTYDLQRELEIQSQIGNAKDAAAKKDAATTKSNRLYDLQRQVDIQSQISNLRDQDAKKDLDQIAAAEKLAAAKAKVNREYDLQRKLDQAAKGDPGRELEGRIAFGPGVSVQKNILEGITKELQYQMTVTRQLGQTASAYNSEQNAQLQTRLGLLKAQTDAARTAAQEEAKARKIAADEAIAAQKKIQAEEEKAYRERTRYFSQISPQSSVKYTTDDSGKVKAVKDELEGANGAAFNLGRSLQHTTAIFDGFMRGQRGQVVASFTALVRDAGILENVMSRLTGVWGLWAAAAVAAGAVAIYTLEQMYQRFMSIREATSQLALGGGFGSVAAGGEAASRFDTIKKETNEYAGAARAMNRELAQLPPAAQSSWKELDKIGKAVAALTHEDPEKVFKELVKAAQSGPPALAELITKYYGLQDVLGPTGKSLVELAKNATNLEEAFKIISGTGAALKINEAGLKAREAGNDFWLLFLAAMGSAEGAQLFAENLDKVLHPLKDIATTSPSVTGAMQAQNAAIEIGNSGLNKRIELYTRLKDAQAGLERLSTDRAATVEQVKAAQTAAGTLGAEFQGVSKDPAEELRHRIALENIHAEAQARHADRTAQLRAAEAVTDETLRSETRRFTDAGADPGTARELAIRSEAYQKAYNNEQEAARKVQDEETSIVLKGIQDRIAAEAHGSKEKIQLQNEYIETVRAAVARGRATEADLENARKTRATFVREANREEYAEAAKNYENQLRSAKGSYEEVKRIIAEWKETAKNYFAENSVDAKRAAEDIERSMILAYRNIVEEAVSSASAMRSANQDILQGFMHLTDTKIKGMGSAGVPAAPGLLAENIKVARELAKIDEERLQNAMKLADAIGNEAEKTKIYWDLWKLGIHTQTTILGIQEKIGDAEKRSYEQTIQTQVAQLKLAEAVAKSRGDLEEIVRLRIKEAEITASDKFATPAQKINAQADIVNALTEEQNRRFSELDRFNSSQERLDRIRIQQEKFRLQAQVADHSISKETMAQKEVDFSSKVMAEEERRIEQEIAGNALTDSQKEKLYSHLAELYEKDAELQIAAQARVSEAIEKENEKRAKLLKGAFDEIGSGLEKSLTGLLTGEKGAANIQDLRKSLTGALVKETFSLGSQYLGSKLAPMLGVKTEGLADTGLGTVLSRAFANLLGLTKDTPKDAMQGAAEKIKKAADAQEAAVKLIKPAADGLKEASDKLKEAADALKGGKGASEIPGGPGARFGGGGKGAEGALPAGFAVPSRSDLVPVSTQGQTALVNKAIQAQAQSFLDELTASGYKITRLGGFREGATVEGKGTPSRHAYGLALDINPSENPQAAKRGDPAVTNLPANTGEMAAKYGGMWGASFGRPDPMHVSFVPQALNEVATSAKSAAAALASVKPPSGSSVPGVNPTPDARAAATSTYGAAATAGAYGPGYALGGPVGTDTVPAWLTPGERVLTRAQRAVYDRMFPRGIEYHAAGGTAGSFPGLTSLSTESRGFAPFKLEQTNPGLGKGWGLLLGLLGAVGLAAGAAWLFGDKDKEKKEKELAAKLLNAKESNTSDVTRTTTPLDVDKLPKMHSGGMVPSTGAYFLEGGEVVTPRDSPTYSPPAGGPGQSGQILAKLGETASTTTSEMAALATDVSKVTQSLSGLARVAGTGSPAQNAMGSLSGILSSVGGAFSGLKSILGMFGSGGSSGGGSDLLGTAGSIFGSISKILPLFMLEKGGIIPSAEGGMVVGGGGLGRGGTLSVLHPGEMVLPRHLSQSVQDMADGGGQGPQPPPINFHINAIDQRSGAQFLMNHRDTIAGLYRQSYRNFNPNVPG